MELGGNENCGQYFQDHGVELILPAKEKYNNYVAEDYKSKLTAEINGEEWKEPDHSNDELFPKNNSSTQKPASLNQSMEALSLGSNSSSNNGNKTSSNLIGGSKKAENEQYFAKLGDINDSRPVDLKPSEGGKYQGFGSSPLPAKSNNKSVGGGSLAGFTLDAFQSDPVGTFSKGWGLFSSTVAKSVKEVNDSVIQPGVKQLSEQDYAIQAKRAVEQFGQKVTETGTALSNQLLEIDGSRAGANNKFGQLFDDLGQEDGEALAPAFGLKKPAKKTELPGMGKSGWGDDDDKWESF